MCHATVRSDQARLMSHVWGIHDISRLILGKETGHVGITEGSSVRLMQGGRRAEGNRMS